MITHRERTWCLSILRLSEALYMRREAIGVFLFGKAEAGEGILLGADPEWLKSRALKLMGIHLPTAEAIVFLENCEADRTKGPLTDQEAELLLILHKAHRDVCERESEIVNWLWDMFDNYTLVEGGNIDRLLYDAIAALELPDRQREMLSDVFFNSKTENSLTAVRDALGGMEINPDKYE